MDGGASVRVVPFPSFRIFYSHCSFHPRASPPSCCRFNVGLDQLHTYTNTIIGGFGPWSAVYVTAVERKVVVLHTSDHEANLDTKSEEIQCTSLLREMYHDPRGGACEE